MSAHRRISRAAIETLSVSTEILIPMFCVPRSTRLTRLAAGTAAVITTKQMLIVYQDGNRSTNPPSQTLPGCEGQEEEFEAHALGLYPLSMDEMTELHCGEPPGALWHDPIEQDVSQQYRVVTSELRTLHRVRGQPCRTISVASRVSSNRSRMRRGCYRGSSNRKTNQRTGRATPRGALRSICTLDA